MYTKSNHSTVYTHIIHAQSHPNRNNSLAYFTIKKVGLLLYLKLYTEFSEVLNLTLES